MRKFLTTALATSAVAGVVLTAGPALASTGPNTQSGLTKMTGQSATSYVDPFFGPVSCNEVHHSKNGNFDSVNCTSTTGSPLTNVSPGQVSSVGWNTDFGAPISEPTGVLNYTVSADGLSYSGIATYGS